MDELLSEESTTLTNLKQGLHIDAIDEIQIFSYLDNWHCNKFAYPPQSLPAFLTPELWQNLTYLYNVAIRLYLFPTLKASRLAGSAFFVTLIKTFDEKIESIRRGTESHEKIHLFSGHESTILVILNFLNLTSAECMRNERLGVPNRQYCFSETPIFASQAIFELYQVSARPDFYVMLRVNGEHLPLCDGSLPSDPNSLKCGYAAFKKQIEENIYFDYKARCQQKK